MKARTVVTSLLLITTFLIIGLCEQTERPMWVSLVALIANPERLDGKVVYVTGYLRLEEEGDAIYLSETDYLHGHTKNSVWVERTKQMETDIEKLDGTYVGIVGVFSAKDLGHGAAHSGAIIRIRNCAFRSDPKYPLVRKLEDERKKVPK